MKSRFILSGLLIAAAPLFAHADEASVRKAAEGFFKQGAVEAVMKRFGAALDDRERLTRVASLPLGHGRALQHVRHLGVYDVIARDYLVFTNGEDAVYAFATTVSGALTHLARAASR